MIFERLHLSGFGIFADAELGPLSPGLNILEGPNEAGKSTTVEFLRSLLFGFQTGRGARKYEPLRGGTHGGWALARDRQGRLLRIERKPGGAAGTAEVSVVGETTRVNLELLLRGSDRQLFSSVFAFSLHEMVGLDALQAEGVRSRIYAAATGTGAGSLLKALSTTTNRADAIFRPRATLPRLNGALRERDGLRQEVERLRGELELYNRLEAERAELESALADRHDAERQSERRLFHARACAAVWESWIELLEYRAALALLPPMASFPEEGLARLERLREDRHAREERKASLGQQLESLRVRSESCVVDELLLEARGELREAAELLGEYEAWQRELPVLELERDRKAQEGEEGLRKLGPGWTEETLSRFDLSIAREDEVRAAQDALSRAAEAVQSTRSAHETAEREAVRRETLLTAAREALQRDFPEEPPALPDGGERLRRLDEAAERLELVQRGLDLLERDAERERELEESQAQSQGRLEAWQAPLPAAWALVLVPCAAFLAWALRDHLPVAAGSGLFILLLAAGLFALLHRQGRAAEGVRTELRQELDRLGKLLAEHRSKAAAARGRLEETQQSLAELERSVGRTLPDRPAVRNLIHELQAAREQRARYEAGLAVVTARHEEWAAARDAVEEAARRHEAAAEALQSRRVEWESWLAARSLPAGILPETALRLFAEITQARAGFRECHALETRVRRTRESLEQFEARVSALFQRVGRPAPRPAELPASVRDLQDALDRSTALSIERSRLGEQMEELRQELELLEGRLRQSGEDLQALLQAAEVEDEEAFRLRASQYAERLRLEAEIRRLERVLESHSGPGPVREALEAELSGLDQETMQLQLERAEAEREAARAGVESSATRLAEVRHELAQLASDERLTSKLRELRSKEAELRDLADEWALHRITHALLEATRQRFEKERQPGIIRRAGSFMGGLTGGRYAGIVAPSGLDELLLEEQDGSRKGLSTWSRGTAEQLYLALRFAFIEDYNASPNTEPLPIIMDDVLVHADGYERLQHAAATIARVAQGCQVLYFTCRPEDAALLTRMDPSAHRFRVSDGTFRQI